MIRDVSDETKHVPDGPVGESTKFVPDGPLATGTATRDLRSVASGLPRFGRFQTTAQLGEGGMGVVYRAHDEVLGREVAIKVLSGEGDLGIRERFVREARAIGALLHPNILALYDAGDEAGTPFLVMELAAGGTLRDRIKAERQLPVDTVREIGIQIARALAAAHAAGIIHRDVKPANILCTQQGTWKLADFGIARTPDSTLTVTGQFLGSPSYAAPESLRAGQFATTSDVYSLGATLYEALAGTPPHGDHDMQSIIRKLEADAPPLSDKRAVPGPLGAAIMAALSRDPAARPTAEQLAIELARTSDGAAVAAVAAAATAQARSHRMKLLAAALATIAFVAVILAAKSTSEPAAQVPGLTRPIEGAGAPVEDDRPREAVNPDEGWDERAGGAPGEGEPQPMFVDQYGNPVDEETARQILEQMEEDARSSVRGRGRGRHKKHKD